jgi:hypothetical protein
VLLGPLLALSLSFAGAGGEAPFRRGDSNADARPDLSDAVHALNFLYVGGDEPTCKDAADSNDDGELDLSDAVYLLNYLFLGGAALPAPAAACGGDPTPDAVGCAAYAPCAVSEGPSEFVTPLDGSPVFAGGPGREGDQAGPGPAPPAEGGAPERLVEESDIYKLDGTNLFVLNRYRGLQVLDLSDLDRPHLIGRAPIFGYPRDMYVRGERAYVIVSDYYTFWREEVAGSPLVASWGSQLRILDIADPRDPQVIGAIDLEGEVSDSRIVGDVMYLVAHRYPWYWGYATTDTEDRTEVVAVSIADPADIRVVDREHFPRNGWEHHVNVSSSAIYLAASEYDYLRESGGYRTRIRHIDISDPAGDIIVRGDAVVPGRVQDRWSLDEFEGVLRVASGQSWGNGDVYLTTLDVSDPDHIAPLGSYTLRVNESLTAARFDGPRGYLVSYRNIDPLFTFDLSDPARPRLLGELEMTGWLDFIVPLGDRLVALGHEDLAQPDGGRTISLAVSLIDVSRQDAPALLSRATLDSIWGWVPAGRDDFAKVFRVLSELGLIVFPFQAWSREDYRYVGGVQLVDLDLDLDRLVLRGLIGDAGWVERGIPFDDTTILSLASEVFQVVDIADRDRPRVRGRLELARNVQDFAPLSDEFAVQLSGDWYRGDTQLTVTPLDDPDTPEPVAQLHLPSPYGRMFRNGSFVYVASVHDVTDEAGAVIGNVTRVQVVDLSDPAAPRPRGSVDLPEAVWPDYGYWYWGWGDEAVQVNGSTLAFHRFPYWGRGCFDCPFVEGDAAAGPAGGGYDYDPAHRIYLVDLSDPDLPAVASTVELEGADWAWGLEAAGTTLYLSFYQSFVEEDRWLARYYLERIEVADPAAPVVLPRVNIPGMFVEALPGTPYIFTLENFWDPEANRARTLLYSLALDGDRAILQSTAEIEGYAYGVEVEDGAAFTVSYWYESTPLEGGVVGWESHLDLVAIDLSDPGAIRVAGRAEVPYSWGYLQAVEGGRAFIGSGIGILSYRVDDITAPEFEEFFRTQGWSQEIVVRGDRAYVPSGYYGVQVLELGRASGP